ncbi:MAG: LysM peptidoglycan-binding domain-containing protein [Verrucomicrobiales bacterium]|nr:LysM peptidoglycan-binding domain-containing protein [Verrucomicrobiota bacterium JB025]
MIRLSAVTRKRRKQRASAATDVDGDDGSSKISRALTIIFLIHIVAIGLIFIHQRFLAGRPAEAAAMKVEIADHDVAPAKRPPIENAPVLSSGENPYIVKAGDNYARIAAAHGVDETDLREINHNVEIQSGLILRLPAKRAAAAEAPVLVEIHKDPSLEQDHGLVDAVPVDVSRAPRASIVGGVASGSTYVVKSGDSIWRIANRFNVSQDALMKANRITDPRRMKIGMELVIPR